MKKIRITIFALVVFANSYSQNLTIPKGTNTIKVIGVNFKDIANSLLDAGYSFEKIDSNYNTIKTDFKTGKDKGKYTKLRLLIRVKDSTAIVTGEWYNAMLIGSRLFGVEQTIENNTEKIEYTYGNPKNLFNEMNTFALSFKKPVEYSKVK